MTAKRRPFRSGTWGRRVSIRTQLLLTVNAVLVTGLAVILFVDYRHDVQQRVRERRAALEGEAITLVSSVRSLHGQAHGELQAYLDDVCAQMSEQSSPGHHIALRIHGLTLQAQAHHRASPAILESMMAGAAASNGEVIVDGRRMVVGHAGDAGTHVYVSEYVADIVGAVRGQVARRSVALAALGLVAALLVNLILLRTFGTPLRRLVETVRKIGQGGFGSQAPSFNSSEFSFLASEINAMSESLAEANEERERQLQKATRIQSHLHPGHPRVDGLEIATVYQPATEIAGDFYDVLRLGDGGWLLAVGDVCGHGVPAAMGAAILKTLLAAAVEASSDLPLMLSQINRRFCSISLPEDFASLILVKWRPGLPTVEYVSAGHETCFLVREDGAAPTLTSSGLVLGVAGDASWEAMSLEAHAGDTLVLLTDGVTESRAPSGEMFGRETLARFVAGAADQPPDTTASRLRRVLDAHRAHFPATDDVTAIIVQIAADVPRVGAQPPRVESGTVWKSTP